MGTVNCLNFQNYFILDLQVTNIGLGGTYDSNTFSPQNNDSLYLDTNGVQQMANFMIFLTNIEAGGATVFPNLGITIWPKTGNAVFW